MGVAGGPDMIENGLVLSLDASDRNSYISGSTRWFDLSGNNNSGSLINGPTFNTGSLGSIVFDGTNDYTAVSHNTSLNLLETFTLSTWIFPTRNNSQDYVFSKFNSYAIIIGYQSGYVNFYNLTYQPTALATQIPVANNQWVNIVYTKDRNIISNNWNGYKNGSSVFSLSQSFTLNPNTSDLLIGSALTNLNFFQGNISNVQLYNRALSAQEVLQNYNATKARFGL